MARRTVINRGNLVTAFSSTVEQCAEKIGTAFQALTQPFLQPDEQAPDVVLMVRLLGRVVRDRFQNLLVRDRADFDERANDAGPRRERNGLSGDLHDVLVKIRRMAEVAYGKEFSLQLVPILGLTASVPSQVYRQGEHTLLRLENPAEEPELVAPGMNPDRAAWAAELRPLVTDLGVSLGEIQEEKAKASTTSQERSESMVDNDRGYAHAYSILRGLLLLSGLERPARDLPSLNRMPRRRRTRTETDPPASPPADSPAEDTGSEPSESTV